MITVFNRKELLVTFYQKISIYFIPSMQSSGEIWDKNNVTKSQKSACTRSMAVEAGL